MNPAPHTYDALNRIANIVEAANNRHFGYSATGNMWVTTTSPAWAPTSFTPRSAEWFNAATNRLVNASLQITHDNAGHLTRIGTHNYAYDAEGRLKSSTINTATTTYEYDGEGRRVKKGNETYVYDAFGNLAAEYGGTVSTPGTQYLTTDHLGSTRLITSTANPAEPRCLDYFPFGEEIPRPSVDCHTPTTEPRQKFTGKERDTETGLDYFGARYMSAAQGRFTTPDWSETPQPVPYADFGDPQTLNLYAYARNNPLTLTDPDGHCPWCLGAVVGGIGGAAASYISQKWSNPGKPVNWKAVVANGVGGAIAGGTLGLATAPAALTTLTGTTVMETGLAVKLGAAAGTGVLGGMVERGIESGGDPNRVTGTLQEVATDVVVAGSGEALSAVVAPVVKATTTAGRVVTLNEGRVAAGTKTPASFGVRQTQLKNQQQAAGAAPGTGVDAATKARQAAEAERRRKEQEQQNR